MNEHSIDGATADNAMRKWLLPAAIALASILLALWAATQWAAATARTATDRAALQLARDNAALLASELQKFRLLPVVLSADPDVTSMLAGSGDAGRVNVRLEELARRTDAAAIYVIDARGRTIAASNHRLPTSFVGQVYGFRPYFRDAMRSGTAELFALGTVSGRPGLYLARRVRAGDDGVGVVVVKIEFEALQRAWARQPGHSIVTDRHGVVIIASRPDWRFRSTRPLDARARREIAATRQFEGLALAPLRFSAEGGLLMEAGRARGPVEQGLRAASVPVPIAEARLHSYVPVRAALDAANGRARTIVLAGAIAAILVFGLAFRARERRMIEARARVELERQVADRTAELRRESVERAEADQRYRDAREDLARANRLALVGQVTVGVAHEINQPVAAIRSFAENGVRLMDAGDSATTRENLAQIVNLTDRIGTITAELRTFSRRLPVNIAAVSLDDAIEGALLLTRDRMNQQGITFARTDPGGLLVQADRIRLEQIVVNLLQNAMEALATTAQPAITLSVSVAATAGNGDGEAGSNGREFVILDVIDNGPGIAPDIAQTLFDPFVTGRTDGLGLGLAIARDIARGFGGELANLPVDGPGAHFQLKLLTA